MPSTYRPPSSSRIYFRRFTGNTLVNLFLTDSFLLTTIETYCIRLIRFSTEISSCTKHLAIRYIQLIMEQVTLISATLACKRRIKRKHTFLTRSLTSTNNLATKHCHARMKNPLTSCHVLIEKRYTNLHLAEFH